MKNTSNKTNSFFQTVYSVLSTFIICIMCVALLFTFVFRTVSVVGESMLPGLNPNDKIIVSKILYTPDYGDIIAISRNAGNEDALIKRVIALPGDKINIDFETHLITVNDRVITENYRVTAPISKKGDMTFPAVVPENCLFVLGDNRNDSLDSRFSEIGFVNINRVEGKAICRISPLSRFNIK